MNAARLATQVELLITPSRTVKCSTMRTVCRPGVASYNWKGGFAVVGLRDHGRAASRKGARVQEGIRPAELESSCRLHEYATRLA